MREKFATIEMGNLIQCLRSGGVANVSKKCFGVFYNFRYGFQAHQKIKATGKYFLCQ